MSNTYEHILAFASEAAAQADPVVGKWWRDSDKENPGSWDMSSCIPHLKCWDTREDVIGEDGEGNPTVTHTYLPGWWICVGLPAVNDDLIAHADCRLVADHHAREVEHASHTVWCLHAAVPMDEVPYYLISP